MCRISGPIFFVSIAKLSDRCFCQFTAAMFVSLRRAQTWRLHTKRYKFGWHTSAKNARMKNSKDPILGEVVYIQSIIDIVSQFLDFIHWMSYDLSLWSHDWWKPRIIIKQNSHTAKQYVRDERGNFKLYHNRRYIWWQVFPFLLLANLKIVMASAVSVQN